ncbi:MAG: serine hydrolase [Gemmatimonadota bacterium]
MRDRATSTPRRLSVASGGFAWLLLWMAFSSLWGIPHGGPSAVSAQEPLWGEALTAKIDSLAEGTLAESPVAAVGIGVKRGQDLLLARGYGLADVENRVPADAETVYRIGSITKQFTAAAIMRLVEQGRIGLDDPMTEYLPDYPTQGHEVTVRHLLTHSSGIKSYTSLEAWRPVMRLDLTHQELLAHFQDEPFDFAPGERFLYSNSGFYLLGMIVEEVSGTSYPDYLDAHLFEPLGLSGSSYCHERLIIPGRAEGYEVEDGELVNDEPISMNQPGAAGALCSTVPDLLVWSDALRTGRVVARNSYRQMTTPGTLNDGSATSYGFGLMLGELEGHARIGHGGGIPGFNAVLTHYPDADLDIVVLSNTNGAHPGRIEETVARWALGIDVPVVRDEALAAGETETYVGVYELRPGFELTISVRDGQLMSQATGQPGFRLRAQGDHVFIPTFDDNVRVEFSVDGNRAESLVLYQAGQEIEARRVR